MCVYVGGCQRGRGAAAVHRQWSSEEERLMTENGTNSEHPCHGTPCPQVFPGQKKERYPQTALGVIPAAKASVRHLLQPQKDLHST